MCRALVRVDLTADALSLLLRRRATSILLLLGLSVLAVGCRPPGPYRLGSAAQWNTAPELMAINEPQIERGRPYKTLDTVGWIVGIPGKILMWDRRVDNHRISFETERMLADYLAVNELDGVKVRINQYAPREEWRRLVANKSVGAGWRYTLGTLSVVGYTLLPGRVFGGDNYNPYTNTINLYSDVPAFAVHEGAHAKDFAGRRYPGTYAALYLLPVVPLYHEAVASRDALAYAHDYWPIDEERQAYRNLGPAYGSYVGSALAGGGSSPIGLPLEIAGILGGHVVGRSIAETLPERDQLYELPPRERTIELPVERVPQEEFQDDGDWYR